MAAVKEQKKIKTSPEGGGGEALPNSCIHHLQCWHLRAHGAINPCGADSGPGLGAEGEMLCLNLCPALREALFMLHTVSPAHPSPGTLSSGFAGSAACSDRVIFCSRPPCGQESGAVGREGQAPKPPVPTSAAPGSFPCQPRTWLSWGEGRPRERLDPHPGEHKQNEMPMKTGNGCQGYLGHQRSSSPAASARPHSNAL